MNGKKDLKEGGKIDPKSMSNDELEYIIRTGKLPPKYNAPK